MRIHAYLILRSCEISLADIKVAINAAYEKYRSNLYMKIIMKD